MRTAERTGLYKDEPWRAISSDRKRKHFFNNPKNWFVTKAQFDFLRTKCFDHFGVSLIRVEIRRITEKWVPKLEDLVESVDWEPIHQSYFPLEKNGSKIGEPITERQALELLRDAYVGRDTE